MHLSRIFLLFFLGFGFNLMPMLSEAAGSKGNNPFAQLLSGLGGSRRTERALTDKKTSYILGDINDLLNESDTFPTSDFDNHKMGLHIPRTKAGAIILSGLPRLTNPINVKQQDKIREFIVVCLRYQLQDVLGTLLNTVKERGFDTQEIVHGTITKYHSPLHQAAEEGQATAFRCLTEHCKPQDLHAECREKDLLTVAKESSSHDLIVRILAEKIGKRKKKSRSSASSSSTPPATTPITPSTATVIATAAITTPHLSSSSPIAPATATDNSSFSSSRSPEENPSHQEDWYQEEMQSILAEFMNDPTFVTAVQMAQQTATNDAQAIIRDPAVLQQLVKKAMECKNRYESSSSSSSSSSSVGSDWAKNLEDLSKTLGNPLAPWNQDSPKKADDYDLSSDLKRREARDKAHREEQQLLREKDTQILREQEEAQRALEREQEKKRKNQKIEARNAKKQEEELRRKKKEEEEEEKRKKQGTIAEKNRIHRENQLVLKRQQEEARRKQAEEERQKLLEELWAEETGKAEAAQEARPAMAMHHEISMKESYGSKPRKPRTVTPTTPPVPTVVPASPLALPAPSLSQPAVEPSIPSTTLTTPPVPVPVSSTSSSSSSSSSSHSRSKDPHDMLCRACISEKQGDFINADLLSAALQGLADLSKPIHPITRTTALMAAVKMSDTRAAAMLLGNAPRKGGSLPILADTDFIGENSLEKAAAQAAPHIADNKHPATLMLDQLLAHAQPSDVRNLMSKQTIEVHNLKQEHQKKLAANYNTIDKLNAEMEQLRKQVEQFSNSKKS